MSKRAPHLDPAKAVFLAASLFTLVFLAFVGWLMSGDFCEVSVFGQQSCQSRWAAFLSSSPNEIGDSLAGVAGTLALIWVVASVVIQRLELSSTVNELRAVTAIETQREADKHIDALLVEYRKAIEDDFANTCVVVWEFEPHPLGKFGAQGTQRLSLKKLEKSFSEPDFFADAKTKLDDLRYTLIIFSEEGRMTSGPSGTYYKMFNSSVAYMRIRMAAGNASAAKKQELKNNGVFEIGEAVHEINDGDWWYN